MSRDRAREQQIVEPRLHFRRRLGRDGDREADERRQHDRMKISERDDAAERHEREHRRTGERADEVGHERRQHAERSIAHQKHGDLREQELEAAEDDRHAEDDRANAAERVRGERQRPGCHAAGESA